MYLPFSFFNISEYPSFEIRTPICLIDRCVMTVVSSASIFSQVLIGLDQHLAVLHPLHYHRRINKIRCLILCLGSWILSIGIGIVDTAVSDSTKSASGTRITVCTDLNVLVRWFDYWLEQ